MENDAAQTGTEDAADLWNEMQAEEDRQAKDKEDAASAASTSTASTLDDEPFEGELEADGDKSSSTEAAAGTEGGAATADADAGAATAAADDIWKDAPAHLREAFLAEKSRNDKVEHDARSQAGRISALQKKIQSLKASTAEAAPAPKIAEHLTGELAEYPEVAEPLSKALSSIEERINSEQGRRQAAQKTELAEATDEFNALTNRAHAFAEKAHPGWQEYLGQNQDEFARWALDQPLAMREMVARNGEFSIDGAEIVTIVSGFKASRGDAGAAANPGTQPGGDPPPSQANKTSDLRRRQLDGSSAPGRGGGRAALTGLPNDAPEKDLWDEMERQGIAT